MLAWLDRQVVLLRGTISVTTETSMTPVVVIRPYSCGIVDESPASCFCAVLEASYMILPGVSSACYHIDRQISMH